MAHRSAEYTGQKELEKGRKAMAKEGWQVVNVDEVKQPVGIKRIATIGFGALFIKPKPHFFVTYERDE